MNMEALLEELNHLNITLWVENDTLRYAAPHDTLTAELKDKIIQQKSEIIRFLNSIKGVANASLNQQIPITPVALDQPIPLSFAQERLWFLDQLEGSNATYNIPKALRLTGALDVLLLEKAFAGILLRHEALRATFSTLNDQPIQQIAPYVGFSLPITDLSALSADEQTRQAQSLVEQDAIQPFDLATGPLFRASLVRHAEQEHLLLLRMHHIISDGWSMGILLNELSQLYQGKELPPLSIQYPDFAAWQRTWLAGDVLDRQLAYWKNQLSGAPVLLELPTDHPRPAIQTFRGKSISFELPAELTQAIKMLARQHNATLFMTIQAAFAILLAKYSRQDDIVIGSPIANRNWHEIEPLIGFFVNTLALRINLSGDPTFSELLKQVQRTTLDAYAHQDLPFEKLVEALNPERTLRYSPIFQVMLVLQNTAGNDLQMPGVQISPVPIEGTIAKFDLTLNIFEMADRLAGGFEFNTDLFEPATIQRLIGHWQTLLEAIVAQPEQKIASLPILTQAERQQILVEWNNTRTDYPKDKTIHQLFEEQVERTPDHIAVSFDPNNPETSGQSLTYRELNQKANQLAHYLLDQGVGPDSLVGICMERSLEMVIGLLGIWKAGAAYLPLDPNYPAERLAYLVQDSLPKLLLTHQHLQPTLSTDQTQVIILDTAWENISRYPNTNLTSQARPQHLAYLIYTSGSTGKPKGVLLPHQGLLNVCATQQKLLSISSTDRILQLASPNFDASIFEMIMAFSSGATLYLEKRETLLPGPEFIDLLQRLGITAITITPAMLQAVPVTTNLPDLRLICVAGEACPPELVFQWAPNRRFFNLYGPTESTIWATTAECSGNDAHTPPIGRPNPNTQTYILDENQQPLPAGIAGELCIAGVGLARGYLNRPDMTAEKFIPNPFSAEPGARMYRTGDLARWLPDGNIEYLGRIDHQVKIRGFRIELGEIEAVLAQHPDVRNTVVLAREDTPGDKRLVAYIVTSQPTQPTDLREHLKAKLPEYMVPSAFVFLDAFPLTPNGKLDRKALPVPDATSLASDRYVAPRTITEEILVGIWVEVLKLDKIGIHDNFFELGGHSLLATQVISRLRKVFHIEMSVRSLFETSNIAELAYFIQTSREIVSEHNIHNIPSIPRKQAIPLSFTQQRFWFLEQMEDGNSTTYNIPTVFHLQGWLNDDALEQAFTEITRRHESLRTIFVMQNDELNQCILPARPFSLPVVDLSGIDSLEQDVRIKQIIADDSRKPFNLSQGPLLRACLVKCASDNTDHILLFNIHHIISDGWSQGIFKNELGTLYTAFANNQPASLPTLQIQYADFTVWQHALLNGSFLDNLLSYWKQELANAPTLLELPLDRPRPAIQTYKGTLFQFSLDAELTRALDAFSRRKGASLFMVLHTAFVVLLSRYSHQNDIVVGTMIANRNYHELEPLIGSFANAIVLRTNITDNATFDDLLQQMRQKILDASIHQDLPFEKLVDELKPERNLSFSPIFQVMFNFHNNPDTLFNLSGIQVAPVATETLTTVYDLALNMHADEGEKMLNGAFRYNTDLFDEITIQRMANHLQVLLKQIVVNPIQKITTFSILSEAEQEQIFGAWNSTHVSYPQGRFIHHLFEEQAERNPGNIAVVFDGQSLTYGELNKRANQLAHCLQKYGVGPDVLVGICLERSLEMVIGLYGILKAGGAYVPFDPDYPDARLAYMLQDAHPRVLLIGQKQIDRIQQVSDSASTTILALDRDWLQIANYPTEAPQIMLQPHNLAYMIYTSGSTGKPKGALNTHAGIFNRLLWMQFAFNLTQADRILQKTPFSFDVSVWEFFWPLMYGARLVVASPERHKDPAYLVATIQQEHITTLHFVPSMLAVFLESLDDTLCPSLLRVICSGEALPADLVKRFSERSQAQLHNLYGPTEAAVDVSWWPCLHQAVPERIPIGRPIANLQLYVLDTNLEAVPVGVTGELHIGGIGLARGYYNRPDLTAEKFIPNPFSAEAGARMYRTGDLVRWLSDGNIEYIGRVDHQVKLRGFRIELGEIEVVLGQHPDVRENVVLIREDTPGDKRLVAYIISQNKRPIESNELRAYLKSKLPEYMIPSAFVFLETLPLSPNGKLDRKVLPPPGWNNFVKDITYEAPRNLIEKAIAEIWMSELGLTQIGREHNFFDLGGDSLLMMRVVTKCIQANIQITLKQMLKHQTIADLVANLSETQPSQELKNYLGKTIPLVPSQAQFFEWNPIDLNFFNNPRVVEIREPLDPVCLEKAFQFLLLHHDAFYLRFDQNANGWHQFIAPQGDAIPFQWIDLESGSDSEQRIQIEAQITKIQLSLNIQHGPLTRMACFNCGQGKPVYLFWTIHHLISDGYSTILLFEDLETVYRQLVNNEQPYLPHKTTPFVEWAEFLANEARNPQYTDTLNYVLSWPWKDIGHLPADYSRDKHVYQYTTKNNNPVWCFLSHEATEVLLHNATQNYGVRIEEMLIAALVYSVNRWTNNQHVIFHWVAHGRESLGAEMDLSRTIGWYAIYFPVLITVEKNSHSLDILQKTKQQLRETLNQGMAYNLLRHSHPDAAQKLKLLPRPRLVVNYFGQVDRLLRTSNLFNNSQISAGWDHRVDAPWPNHIEVNCAITKGQLLFDLSFNTSVYLQSTIEKLVKNTIKFLEELALSCKDQP